MFVSIITDCKDPNAMGRQATRAAALLGCPVTTLGVEDQFEATGCLIDTLDAARNQPGWVLVNIAPRNRFTSRTNGPPFGYLESGRIRVIATLNTLSLMPTVGIKTCTAIDVEEVLTEMVESGEIDGNEKYRIQHSQFRSFDFSIPLVRWLSHSDYTFPEEWREDILPWCYGLAWYVDCFGNIKTNLSGHHAPQAHGTLTTNFGDLPFFQSLSDVPEGELAAVIGSSGLGEVRFVELVIKGGSAAERLGIKVGDRIV